MLRIDSTVKIGGEWVGGWMGRKAMWGLYCDYGVWTSQAVSYGTDLFVEPKFSFVKKEKNSFFLKTLTNCWNDPFHVCYRSQ